jgi:hypothetical protein
MYKASHVLYTDLTPIEQENASENGAGKERASYIVIDNGIVRKIYSDAMEAEDAVFYRDLSWIANELNQAYIQGKEDGLKEKDNDK